jgi:hypothetical protein
MADGGRKGADSALIVALACGQPVHGAAEMADVSERTVYRRLQDEAFRASLARERARLVEEAVGRLALGMTTAADTLVTIATDLEASASARVSAARANVSFRRRGV